MTAGHLPAFFPRGAMNGSHLPNHQATGPHARSGLDRRRSGFHGIDYN
jgi:hypothetical protein